MTENHAVGNVSNGYFLAARQDGVWVIVYDGQANPPCRDIDFNGFPSELVPECLNDYGQLVNRSGGEYVRVGEALAEYHGEQVGETNYSIVYDTGSHVLGYSKQGYFLAAKTGEKWLIAFAGNGTPYCAQVDLHNFPPDMVPECMDTENNLVYRSVSVSPPSTNLQSLDCGPGSAGSIHGTVENVACNIRDSLLSRNTSALIGYMTDPFIIGYWLSEGVSESPEIQIQTIQGGRYAVFRHVGTYEHLDAVYSAIHEQWLPKSEKHLRNLPSFCYYHQLDASAVPEDCLVSDIYIPVE